MYDIEAGRTIPVICDRCSGDGYWVRNHWNQDGVCFKCRGVGNLGYQTEDERAADEADRRARVEAAEKKAARLRARVAKALKADPELAKAFDVNHRIINDIQDRFARKPKISEAQRDLVLKIAGERADRAAAEVARKDALTDLAAGRYELEGEIVSVKIQQGYRNGDTTIKILVELDGGNRVYGTAPQSIMWESGTDEHGDFARPVEISGRRVKMVATVEPRERGFAIYKRPAKATLTA